ncbi:hypothetical protein SDC9_174321 [bioreactor metagenome]|uniref:Uncharacterized protein n=1 Tax=bioreactor metagenome TaxID=1076179 RepID=A0A645GJK2_9ZZZZ
MPVNTATASAKIGAIRLHPLRRGHRKALDPPGIAGLHRLRDAQFHRLAADGAGYEYHRAVDSDNPKALAGVALHRSGIEMILQ